MLSIFSCAYWSTICLWRKVYFCPFFNWVVCFLLFLSYMSCLYILEIKPQSVASFATVFSHCVCCLFILFMVSFAVQKPVNVIRNHLFIFVFISIALGEWPKEIFGEFMSENVLPMFSSSFMVSYLMFKFFFFVLFCLFFVFFFFDCALGMQKFLGQGLNLCHNSNPGHCSDYAGYLIQCATRELPMFKSFSHFKFIFVHGVRVCSSFIDLHAAVQISQHHLLERIFPFYIPASFVKD